MSLGSRIMFLRKQAGLTQQQLADRLGVSFQAVSCYEHDQYAPDIGRLSELAAILGTTADRLLEKSAAEDLPHRERFYDETHMHSFIRLSEKTKDMPALRGAVSFAEAQLGNVFLPGTDVPYSNLALSLACHSLSLGLDEDACTAALLCYIPLVTALSPDALPCGERARGIVSLFTASRRDGIAAHRDALRKDPAASLLLCLDGLHADTVFPRTRAEAAAAARRMEEELLPLVKTVKAGSPAENDAAWGIAFSLMRAVELARRYL